MANPIAVCVDDMFCPWGDSSIMMEHHDELTWNSARFDEWYLFDTQNYLKVSGWCKNALLDSSRVFAALRKLGFTKAARIKARAMRHWATLSRNAIRPNGALRGGYGSAFAMAAPRI